MTKKIIRTLRILLVIMLLAAQFCMTAASADDEALLYELPGEWVYTADFEEGLTDLASLILEKDGTMTLRSIGENAYTAGGTWSLELVTDYSYDHGLQDRLTLLFTSTDNPLYAGSEYSVECVYYVYAESWVENVTRYTYLITEDAECSGGTPPLKELCSEDGAAVLHKEEGPNMRVVNCKNYVSLRQDTSKTSKRLAKVPLGELVFAFPEEEEENGFIRCVYRDEYGCILSEYLQPVE